MKNLHLILFVLLMASCGVYKYEFRKHEMQIVSKKGNRIDRIYILCTQAPIAARFDARKEKPSKRFSLKDFSPDYFECSDGKCPFQFEKDLVYMITLFPSGDRTFPPMKVKMLSDSSIVQIRDE